MSPTETSAGPAETAAPANDSNQPTTNGAAKPPKPTEAAAEPKKLTGAQLKALKKAEKQAKRQEAATEKPENPPPAQPQKGQQQQQKGQKQKGQQGQGQGKQQQSQKQEQKDVHTGEPVPGAKRVQKPKEKQVDLFAHHYGHPRRYAVEGASKDVHPVVLALGLQMASYEVCGSAARCVAMLEAFKTVIRSYTTPPGTALARHLTSYYLSPQIEYLKSCRPLSISMGNAIRYLKDLIVKIDPDVPEQEAKDDLISAIENYIRERFTLADKVIASNAASRIQNGDTICCYAKSSIVMKSFLHAHTELGKRFSVVCVGSKPLNEGKRLASSLAAHGIPVTYYDIRAAYHAVSKSSKVMLGAHAMTSNGWLYSRVGTSVIAMFAHDRAIPVIVCCESAKFTTKVALDSVGLNEVSPADELFDENYGTPTAAPSAKSEERDAEKHEEEEKAPKSLRDRWKGDAKLGALNLMFDATRAEWIDVVVTEYASLPPSSVDAVLRSSGYL